MADDITPGTPNRSFMDKAREKFWPSIMVAVIVGYLLGASTAQDTPTNETAATSEEVDNTDEEPVTEESAEEEPEPEPEPEFDRPTKSDFKLNLRKLDEACFGSAGCNTEVRVVLKNMTGITLDPAKTYELRYRIVGGNDPVLSTLEITGDNYTVDEHFLDTQQGANLEAVVVSVSEF